MLTSRNGSWFGSLVWAGPEMVRILVRSVLGCRGRGGLGSSGNDGERAGLPGGSNVLHMGSVRPSSGRSLLAVQVKSAGAGRTVRERETESVLVHLVTGFEADQSRLTMSAVPDEGCLLRSRRLCRTSSRLTWRRRRASRSSRATTSVSSAVTAIRTRRSRRARAFSDQLLDSVKGQTGLDGEPRVGPTAVVGKPNATPKSARSAIQVGDGT